MEGSRQGGDSYKIKGVVRVMEIQGSRREGSHDIIRGVVRGEESNYGRRGVMENKGSCEREGVNDIRQVGSHGVGI